MPIPSVYVTRFFQLVTARRFAEAERVLQRLRQKIQTTEWNSGYFQALYGILLAQRSNDDRYAFLPNLNLSDEEELQSHRREFSKRARSRFHADYDRGYFAAWASYLRVLAKLEFDAGKAKSKSEAKKEIEAQAKAEKKVIEKAKEKTEVERRKEAVREVKAEAEKREVREAEATERIEPRQSTLFDFSK